MKGLFLPFPQFTTDGREVQVLSTGHHNLHAGPDFTDVHLRIDGIELVGEVEIHINSRDWYYHHHNLDSAYNHILLHVVSEASEPIFNSLGESVMQLELKYNPDKDYLDSMFTEALSMDSALAVHRCSDQLLTNPDLLSDGWRNAMLHQRLTAKKDFIEQLLHLTHGDWQYAFYICLSHALGFHVNGIPMELLALSTPLAILAKHRDNVTQLSALLLGQAGLINTGDMLWKEYTFLRHKYQLTPIDATLWKRGRLRPHNQPHVRILQLVQLIHLSDGLLSQCLETADIKQLQQLFTGAAIGKDSINSLLINVVAPFVYARGQHQQAILLLERLPAENNRVTRQWRTLGQQTKSAADTQALLHLNQTYCEQNRCIQCEVWNEL